MSSVTAVPIPPVKRRYVTYLVLGLLLAVAGAAALAWQAPVDFLTRNGRAAGVVTTPSGLQYKVLTAGAGEKPTDADVALINYVGKLPDGSVFDQSQQPTPMPVAGVVPGFSEAMKLMPKGAKYRIWIKPELGYGGPRPAGDPPLEGKAIELSRQVLTFDVEMIDFLPESVVRQMQAQQMQQQQMQGGGGMPGGPPMPGGAPMPAPAQPGR